MKRRWIIGFLVLVACIYGLGRLYFILTDDFRVGTVTHTLPIRPEWNIAPLTAEEKTKLHAILDQPYSYLGKGAQAYAFASEDGKYVFKFFKFKHILPKWWYGCLPDWEMFRSIKEKEAAYRVRKYNRTFNAHKLAFENDKKNTGLIYVHLNPSQDLHETFTVTDKIGRSFTFNLDEIVFVIQERGETLGNEIHKSLKKGHVDLVNNMIDKIWVMYMDEYTRGIWDQDHGVTHNTGLLPDKRPFHLDVGMLHMSDYMKQKEEYKPDLLIAARRVQVWIKRHYPAYYAPILSHMEETLSHLLGEPIHL